MVGFVGIAPGAVALALLAMLASARAEVVVAAGRSVPLMTLSSVDQGCHALGPVTINVIDPPRGGYIEVSQVRAYPNFSALNTRSRCNTLKLPATRVTYQSAGTFLGTDFVTIEAIFPEGAARRIRVPVSVRPVAPGAAPPDAAADAQTTSGLPESPLEAPPKKPARPKPPKRVARRAPPSLPCPDNICRKTDRNPSRPARPSTDAPVLTPL